MEIFIDSANVGEIEKWMKMGIIDGVTTDPSLVAKTGKKFRELLVAICEVVKGPVSAEVVALDYEGMMREARELAKLKPNIVVKIPMTTEGLKATKTCADEGIQTNVTLCFSANQALLAAKAGATYISPFVGRIDDVGDEGMDLIADVVTIYENYEFATQVLVASVRHPIHVLTAARIGADVATCPFAVLKQLAQHPLTDIGLQKFLKDWEKVPR